MSIRNLFERLATDKKDKCTLFRSEQEWKLYVLGYIGVSMLRGCFQEIATMQATH